jgi:hypothetical protein
VSPRSYFLLGVVFAAAVLVAGWASRTEECVQAGPAWFAPFVYIVGTLSMAAIFASIFTWSRQYGSPRGWTLVTWVVQAVVGAGVWGFVGFLALVWIALPPGCLD